MAHPANVFRKGADGMPRTSWTVVRKVKSIPEPHFENAVFRVRSPEPPAGHSAR